MKLPQARTENLVEQNLKNETLMYDLVTNKAFNLNETLSVVYKACNGVTTFDELKRKHKFTDDFIYLALDELKRNDLLADENDYHSPFVETSRREVIKRIGLTSVVALPLIVGLTAPKAISAQSEPVCNFDTSCTCSVRVPEGQEIPFSCLQLGGTTNDCANVAGCDCILRPDNSGVCGELFL